MTGQVDVVTGWQTNATALKVLGSGPCRSAFWDAGVRSTRCPITPPPTPSRKKADLLAKFLRATSKGWAYACANRDASIDLLVKEFPEPQQGG